MMQTDLKRWQAQRHAELSAPESWLGMVGLFWLNLGDNRVGSADDAVVKLPGGPAILGEIVWQGERLVWRPVNGLEQPLLTDLHGSPSVIDHENLSFFVVDRDGQLAVRVRNRDWASTRPFGGLSYFDYDPAWRIMADWLALSPPLVMEVPNVSGDLKVRERDPQSRVYGGRPDG